MRTQVIDKIKDLALTGYNVSVESPYDDSGNPLYIKDPKVFYIDHTQTVQEPLFLGLDGLNINNSTTSVTVYFTVDAKNVPANYETTINSLKGIKDTISFDGSVTRNCNVSTSYESDLMISEVEYNFTRIT